MMQSLTHRRDEPRTTALQEVLQALATVLGDAGGLEERSRSAFAPIAQAMLLQRFARELAVAEAESFLEAA
jgi:hypothetical protein